MSTAESRRVRDVMTSSPTTVTKQTNVVEAARLMKQEDVGPLPVVEGDALVGIVTDRDLVLRVVAEGRDPGRTTVGEVCSSDPVTVSPDTDLAEALSLLARNQVRRLPVAEGGRLVGILAQADVAREGPAEAVGDVLEDISR